MSNDLDMTVFEGFMWVDITWNSLTGLWTARLPNKAGIKQWVASDTSLSEALIKAYALYLMDNSK